MEKKAVFTAALILVLPLLLVSEAMFVDLAEANIVPPVILPSITISSDGSISPPKHIPFWLYLNGY